MPGAERVRVEGLSQFTRSLRSFDRDLAKGVRVGLNEAANFLIGQVKPLIPRRTGKAANSLKARSTQQAVRIGIGGKKAPYYPWLDFGGSVGRSGGVRRPFIKEGRYLYPTFSRSKPEFEKILEKSIADVARRAGLDVD